MKKFVYILPLLLVSLIFPSHAFADSPNKLIFRSLPSSGDTGYNIDRVDSDGTNRTTLSQDPMAIKDNPDWSPDGTKIAYFATNSAGTESIFVMNANGTGVQQLTSSDPDRYDESPDWLPMTTSTRQLTALSSAKIWVNRGIGGILGTKFDYLAQVYKDNTLVSSGQINNVTPGLVATQETIPFSSFSPVAFPAGSQLKVTVSTRTSCSGLFLPNINTTLYYNTAANNSQFGATIGGSANNYFLRSGSVLATTAGTGSQQTAVVNGGAKCSAFKSFGTWTITP